MKRWDAKGLGKWAAETRAEQLSLNNRYYDPPKPVMIRAGDAWWPGRLDAWARANEDAEWFGRASYDQTRATSWYRPTQLRPIKSAGHTPRRAGTPASDPATAPRRCVAAGPVVGSVLTGGFAEQAP